MRIFRLGFASRWPVTSKQGNMMKSNLDQMRAVLAEPKVSAKWPDYVGLGEMLREARESHGVSFEQAAKDMHIRSAYLQALETGKLEEIQGGTVYAKGYLRLYAGYLGVNLDTMLGMIRERPPQIRPIASVSSAHAEPRRIQTAAVLSLVAIGVLVGLWQVTGQSGGVHEVPLVRPVPKEMIRLPQDGEVGEQLRQCLATDAMSLPRCPSWAERHAFHILPPGPLRSVMELGRF